MRCGFVYFFNLLKTSTVYSIVTVHGSVLFVNIALDRLVMCEDYMVYQRGQSLYFLLEKIKVCARAEKQLLTPLIHHRIKCMNILWCCRLQEARLEVLKQLLKQREENHQELNIKRLDKLWWVTLSYNFIWLWCHVMLTVLKIIHDIQLVDLNIYSWKPL